MIEKNAARGVDSPDGMVDVQDRRPVAVSAEDARRWLDPALTVEEAEHLARTAMLDVDLFEWFPVSRALNTGGGMAFTQGV